MSGPLVSKEVVARKKQGNGSKGAKKKKDPFTDLIDDLDCYDEGCDPRTLMDSGE